MLKNCKTNMYPQQPTFTAASHARLFSACQHFSISAFNVSDPLLNVLHDFGSLFGGWAASFRDGFDRKFAIAP
jgi:citrate lyase beta subunit